MESATIASEGAAGGTGDKGLKKGAIGFADGLAIGLDSTAPAYSIAAVIGSIVIAVGVTAPGNLLLAFVPMFFIAAAFYYMNRADQDCGTTFSWVTRAMGPWFGWIGGWAIFTTGVLVVGSLADVSAFYIYKLFGLDGLKNSREAVIAFAAVIIVVMTTICVIGTEVSARLQRVLVTAQVGALVLFAVVALIKVIAGDVPSGSLDPSLSWLNPLDVPDYSALLSGLLLGVFIYWGWESAVNLTEETEGGSRVAGLAGVVSVVILLATYVGVAVALIAYAGTDRVDNFADNANVLGAVADEVLGPLAFLVTLAIVTSGLASTQTTILPGSRTSLSMAARGAFPRAFAHIHPRFLTPDFSTIVIGAAATIWYVAAASISENFLFDSLSALSLMIAFYYALTGIACAIYWRRELLKSVKNLLFIGVAPLLGAAMLLYLLGASARDLANPDPNEPGTGTEVLGVGMPLAIAIAFVLLGLILMVVWRITPAGRPFFRQRGLERVSDEIAREGAEPTG